MLYTSLLSSSPFRRSPEDQAVLEAAYKRDPKPDRAARLDIVSQVALGEKEVQVSPSSLSPSCVTININDLFQIWFQNRRQSSRRKARPLLPHEIAQYQLGRSSFGSTDGSEPRSSLDASGIEVFRQTDTEGLSEREKKAKVEERTTESQIPTPAPPVDTVGDRARAVLQEAEERVAYEPPTSSFPPPSGSQDMGYLSNRRSGSFFRSSQGEPPTEPPYVTSTPPSAASRSLKRVSSVHLAMDSEGKAVVSTKDGTDPSPPRAPQLPPSAFGLSTSSQGTVSSFRQSLGSDAGPSHHKKLRRSTSGRSRDSRTWEFWCDKDARLEAEKAESQPQSRDSAADAIGLMRSNSGRRSILGSGQHHRRGSQRQLAGPKRARLSTDRAPLLPRSSTWQPPATTTTITSNAPLNKPKPKPKLKYTGSQVSVYIPGNDSDKENWSPERPRQYAPTYNHAHPPPPQPALGQNRNATNTSATPRMSSMRSTLCTGSPSTSKARRHRAADGGGENDAGVLEEDEDSEIAAFMGGSRTGARGVKRASHSSSQEEDLDCVQGLLSLREGLWR